MFSLYMDRAHADCHSHSLIYWTITIFCKVGYITEDDVKMLAKPEKIIIDQIIDKGPCPAGEYKLVRQGSI